MMHMIMLKSTKKILRHSMISTLLRNNLNPNNKFSSSIQGFGYFPENSSQDGLDHSLSHKYFLMWELRFAIRRKGHSQSMAKG